RVFVDEFCSKYKPDLIISDNRYGFYFKGVRSIIISHQLNVKFPLISSLINKWVKQSLSCFDTVWVPDWVNNPGLSADLGHPKKYTHKDLQYIGPLSRFEKSNSEKDLITAIISGPGKQKAIFLNQVFSAFKKIQKLKPDQQFCIVYGGDIDHMEYLKNTIIHQLPEQKLLEDILNRSDFVIAR